MPSAFFHISFCSAHHIRAKNIKINFGKCYRGREGELPELHNRYLEILENG